MALDPGLKRLVLKARAILLFERAWQALLPPSIVAGAFVSLSWAGVWLAAPHWLRELGVVAGAICLAASLLPLRRFRWPSCKEALERIDQASGLAFWPATVLADRLGNGGNDPMTLALWRLHLRRAARAIPLLCTGKPSPRTAEADPYAARAFVLIALIATGFVAGPQKYTRLAAAFDWQLGSLRGTDARVDAWIDPPAYTGRMPSVLNLAKSQGFFAAESPELIQAPIGSTVVIHASGGTLDLSVNGALAEAKKENVPGAQAAPHESKGETRLLLGGDAKLKLGILGHHLGTFDIRAIPDDVPSIALIGEPKFNLRGTFELKYSIADDYGAVSAEARFANPVLPGGRPAKRSLADPPRVPLMLPPPPNTGGEAKTAIDLTDHPWAGARVQMKLAARDDAGNEGTSTSTMIVLPQKPLQKPLARALAEQRRALILDPDDKARVANALDALMIAPGTFGTSAGVYLGLRVAQDRLTAAHTDDDLRETADLLWQMALRIENGDLSQAERDLRAAGQELREAMQRGASAEEIRELAENLRAAMDKFLRELAAQQENDLKRQDESARGGNSRIVRPKDLQKMLDDLQAMLRSGDTANAQRMLEQLQNVLENLRLARPRKPNPMAREVGRALDELSHLSQDQQDLRDETYQSGAGQRQQLRRGQQRDFGELPPGLTFGDIFGQQPGESFGGDGGLSRNDESTPGTKSGPKPDNAGDLANRQKALRGRLENLQKHLSEAGAAAGNLDGAKGAMTDAEGALRDGPGGNNGAAVDAQGRAVEALREGAQKLAESMQGEGEGTGGGGEGEGQGSGFFGPSADTDPLGRPNGRDNGFARYDPMGAPAAQRARRVLEELRRRLGEPGRPQDELDYLERLLRRY
ncbi:MAG: TIGR02302 family protein [Methylocapsa sp.]|nr:TIGR02302 family protein [Methylocapsa sp.]